ncbi:MAG: N-acetylmuramoyl-L-alanine amidase family protein [Lachnospiraceae bacterium]|jgi:N-acetylmuramoyl-L-alanine amidase
MGRRTGRYMSRRQRRRRQLRRKIMLFGLIFLCAAFGILLIKNTLKEKEAKKAMDDTTVSFTGAPPLDVQLLTINEYSRPAIAISGIKGIVVHYTANPGSTAQENRNYFEGLKDSHETKVSSHFIVGLDGEVIQCIPSSEIAYASNERNTDTLSIECCHPDESGEFREATYDSLVQLTGWLCERFGLTSENVIRHYDVTGKNCPKYFVENEVAWEKFREDVEEQIQIVKNEQKEAGES